MLCQMLLLPRIPLNFKNQFYKLDLCMGMHNEGKFNVKCLCTKKPRFCHWLCQALYCCSSFDVCEHTSCILLRLRFFTIIFNQAFFMLHFGGQGEEGWEVAGVA
jgi:hypothetical protein